MELSSTVGEIKNSSTVLSQAAEELAGMLTRFKLD
jgi:hypothetical protein